VYRNEGRSSHTHPIHKQRSCQCKLSPGLAALYDLRSQNANIVASGMIISGVTALFFNKISEKVAYMYKQLNVANLLEHKLAIVAFL
jgi:hypothetical protein